MSCSRILILIGTLVYAITLQWVYPHFLVPVFSYSGMVYQPQPLLNLLLQIGFIWLPGLWLPTKLNKPSQFQNWILYLTVVAPSCILPYHVTALPSQVVHGFLVLMLVCFAGLCAVSTFRQLRLPKLSLSPLSYGFLLAGITLVTYAGLIVYRGLPALFLPIDEVYSLRTELRSANLPIFFNYLLWWQGAVVNPIISSIGFARRKWLLIGLGALLQIVLYSITSLRFFLAATVFQIGLGLFMGFIKRHRGATFLYSIIASVLAAVVWLVIDPRAFSPLLLLERWIFNGGQLSGYYFEFFYQNPHAGLKDTSFPLLPWLFPGPYDLPIGQVIGREYFIQFVDGSYTNATAHFWADSYASFGIAGIVIGSCLAGCLLWVADSVCDRSNRHIAVMSFAIVSLSLTGQSVLTTILTGGLAPFILLMMLIPKRPKPSIPISLTSHGT